MLAFGSITSKMTAERTLKILSFADYNSFQNTLRAKPKQVTSRKVLEYIISEQMITGFMVWQRQFCTLRQTAGYSEKASHKEREIIANV